MVLWDKFQEWASQEVREVRRAPAAFLIVLGLGVAAGWYIARWVDAREIAIMQRHISYLNEKSGDPSVASNKRPFFVITQNEILKAHLNNDKDKPWFPMLGIGMRNDGSIPAQQLGTRIIFFWKNSIGDPVFDRHAESVNDVPMGEGASLTEPLNLATAIGKGPALMFFEVRYSDGQNKYDQAWFFSWNGIAGPVYSRTISNASPDERELIVRYVRLRGVTIK